MEEAQQNYSYFLNAIDEVLHELPTHEVVPEVPNEARGSRIKDLIIIVLVVVIVKLLFF